MRVLIFSLFISICLNASAQIKNPFLVNPYLQTGYHPTANSLQLLWQSNDENADWSITYMPASGKGKTINNISFKKIAVANVPAHRLYEVLLDGLKEGSLFEYTVLRNKEVVFSTSAHAPKAYNQPFNFVVFGDVGAGSKEAKNVADAVYKANTDLVLIPGDIVYEDGLAREYTDHFWPIYNAARPDSSGMPIMSRSLFVAATGNHDADTRDLDKSPDALAYYYYWQQPLNGPECKEGSGLVPLLKANDTNRNAFIEAAGKAYPSMTNFSYNYGNAHLLIIDADNYIDVTDTALTNWISRDLEAAKNYEWKFVMYHHPGFNSSVEHYEQQQTRLLAPIFEKEKVDVVFSGHVHNYQRSYPLTFQPQGRGVQLLGGRDNKSPRGKLVSGFWKNDLTYDGKANTKPNGVIYLVTGAGGQELYDPKQQHEKDTWQGFTYKLISQMHSFTLACIDGKKLTVSQLTSDGKEIDQFVITH
ncbi:metallophosphoesterase [Chitinophagaceae bacterium 26-R-25]|nr:metallophosphoesterase [Chitinophagaceae bacterium 26-R-25]